MRGRLIPLFAAVLITFVSAADALPLSSIRTAVRRNVRDTATSTSLQRYSDALLNDIINEGQRDVVSATWIIQNRANVTVTGGLSAVLPTDVIQVYRVKMNGSNLPEVTLQQLDADSGDTAWLNTVSTAAYFVQDHTSYSGSQMELTIYPSQSTSQIIVVFYYGMATDLASDSDQPFNGLAWFAVYDDLLVWYATARLLYIEGMFDKATNFRNLYDSRLQQLWQDYGVKPQKVPAVPQKEQKP